MDTLNAYVSCFISLLFALRFIIKVENASQTLLLRNFSKKKFCKRCTKDRTQITLIYDEN
jgi:hypothetical protein